MRMLWAYRSALSKLCGSCYSAGLLRPASRKCIFSLSFGCVWPGEPFLCSDLSGQFAKASLNCFLLVLEALGMSYQVSGQLPWEAFRPAVAPWSAPTTNAAVPAATADEAPPMARPTLPIAPVVIVTADFMTSSCVVKRCRNCCACCGHAMSKSKVLQLSMPLISNSKMKIIWCTELCVQKLISLSNLSFILQYMTKRAKFANFAV